MGGITWTDEQKAYLRSLGRYDRTIPEMVVEMQRRFPERKWTMGSVSKMVSRENVTHQDGRFLPPGKLPKRGSKGKSTVYIRTKEYQEQLNKNRLIAQIQVPGSGRTATECFGEILPTSADGEHGDERIPTRGEV
jgi:hypothetical protein